MVYNNKNARNWCRHVWWSEVCNCRLKQKQQQNKMQQKKLQLKVHQRQSLLRN